MQSPLAFFFSGEAISWFHLIGAFLVFGFQVWMFVDAIKRGEYLWAVFIIIGSLISTVLYYFLVFRASGGALSPVAFELPGAADRKQIKQLLADIHHLDKAHLYRQLADIYFSQGKLELAEANYRSAYQRDSKDEDNTAHLGNCLARRGKFAEALPLLESVCAQNPKHEYGNTLMALAECQSSMGRSDQAATTWRNVMGLYSYSRARVQYAQILIERKEYTEARKCLEEVTRDAPYATKFQSRNEAAWVRKAKLALRSLP